MSITNTGTVVEMIEASMLEVDVKPTTKNN
jgi:hypothetical protein